MCPAREWLRRTLVGGAVGRVQLARDEQPEDSARVRRQAAQHVRERAQREWRPLAVDEQRVLVGRLGGVRRERRRVVPQPVVARRVRPVPDCKNTKYNIMYTVAVGLELGFFIVGCLCKERPRPSKLALCHNIMCSAAD